MNEKEWREQLAPLGLTTAQFNDLRKMAVAGAVKAASDIWRASVASACICRLVERHVLRRPPMVVAPLRSRYIQDVC